MMGHDKLEKKLIPLNSGIRGQSEKIFWISPNIGFMSPKLIF